MNRIRRLFHYWHGSVQFRLSLTLMATMLAIMTLGAVYIGHSQADLVRRAAEAHMTVFSQAWAMMGAVAVMDNLFLIQEAMSESFKDPDVLQVDVIDKDDMIVAAKHPERIGLVLTDPEWRAMKQAIRTVHTRETDGPRPSSLIIVEPLKDRGHPIAWLRCEFSLAQAEKEKWNVIQSLGLMTATIMIGTALIITRVHRTLAKEMHGILTRLRSTLQRLHAHSASSIDTPDWAGAKASSPAPQKERGPLEQLTSLVLEAAALLEQRTQHLQEVMASMEQTIQERTRELRQMHNRAAQDAKAKATLLAVMSHEIRTPMNGVVGLSELLLSTSLSEDQKTRVQFIHRSALALLGVINNILDLSNIESGTLQIDPRPFRLSSLVDDIVALLRTQAQQKGLTLSVRLDDAIPCLVVGDDLRLRQVLTNLVDNAIKFTDSGRVAVTVTLEQETNRHITLTFAVTDTGVGISHEDKERLFHHFSRGSQVHRTPGCGLGLAISRQLVELMGGTLICRSEEQRGSTFQFSLTMEKTVPMSGPDPAMDDVIAPANWTGKSDFRILVVEDDPVSQEVIRGMVTLLGCSPTLASTGQDAVTAVHLGHYDLVLMDWQLPDGTGDAFTATLRRLETHRLTRTLTVGSLETAKATYTIMDNEAEQPLHDSGRPIRLPIIAMTANFGFLDRETLRTLGFDDLLAKPLRIQEVASMLARWTGWQGSPDQIPEPLGDRQPSAGTLIRSSLDVRVIESLRQIELKHHNAFIARVIDRFVESTTHRLSQLQQAVHCQDVPRMRAIIHSVHSSCSGIGAIVMMQHCQRFLYGASTVSRTSNKAFLSSLRTEFDQVRLALQALTRSGHAPNEHAQVECKDMLKTDQP